MIRKDCFGYVPGRRNCQILTENICEKRKCSFFKTKEAYKRGLLGLPPAQGVSLSGVSGKRGKSVMCIETGEVFASCALAEKVMNLPNRSVSGACRGKQKSVKGFTFRYVEEE